jgi:hypothetical protein
MNQLNIRQELKKVPNRTFLRELQNRLREKKIKERELAKILSELIFNQNEQESTAAYEEWANDPDEQAEIKIWKATERDN